MKGNKFLCFIGIHNLKVHSTLDLTDWHKSIIEICEICGKIKHHEKFISKKVKKK